MDFENNEFRNLLESIKMVYGYDFTEYAEASVRRRIQQFMGNKKLENLESLARYVLQNERQFEEMVQEVSVTVTEMFRDPLFYKSIRNNVVKHLATYPLVKIWIAGCATGEEVYSFAILLKEMGLLDRCIIYATDINQKSLRIAKDGMYSIDNMKKFTVNYQQSGGTSEFSKYYTAKYNAVMFDKSLRDNIVFAPHNLAVESSFNEFQMIICRNVLIYFNQQLQNKVIQLFHDSLCTLGFLGLGNKESLIFSESRKCFEEIDRKEKIFRKIC